jgi:hypothetical protein
VVNAHCSQKCSHRRRRHGWSADSLSVWATVRPARSRRTGWTMHCSHRPAPAPPPAPARGSSRRVPRLGRALAAARRPPVARAPSSSAWMSSACCSTSVIAANARWSSISASASSTSVGSNDRLNDHSSGHLSKWDDAPRRSEICPLGRWLLHRLSYRTSKLAKEGQETTREARRQTTRAANRSCLRPARDGDLARQLLAAPTVA